MRTRLSSAIAFALVFGPGVSIGVAQTIVDTCGETFSGAGVLTGDLDCSAVPGAAVTIDGGGALDLAGFTLSALDVGVWCEGGACELFSNPPGGEIAGGDNAAVLIPDDHTATVRDVVLRDAYAGVSGAKLRVYDVVVQDCEAGLRGRNNVIVERTTITGCSQEALSATYASIFPAKLTVVDSVITGNAVAIEDFETTLTLVNSDVSGNASGVRVFAARVESSTVTGNGDYGLRATRKLDVRGGVISGNGLVAANGLGAIRAERVSVRDATVDGNHAGIVARYTAKVRNSAVTDSVQNGIVGAKVVVLDTTVTGNGGHGLLSRTFDNPVERPPFMRAKLAVRDSVVTGNGLFGALASGSGGNAQDCVEPGPLTLRSTDLTGNGTDAACGVTEACGSVGGCVEPKLPDTACDTSYVTGSGLPGSSWSLCTLD